MGSNHQENEIDLDTETATAKRKRYTTVVLNKQDVLAKSELNY